MNPAPQPQHNPQEAARFLQLLDESADTFSFRVFDDNEQRKDPRLAGKFEGALADVWPRLLAAQAQGCGVYVVANAGAQTNDTIYRVRVVFGDFDGTPLPDRFELEPHIIVQSSPGKFHVYWLVDDLPLDAFRDVQRSIAARYGSDRSVNDLARVMRLPGLLHQKREPFLVRIIHESGALPYSAATVLAEFPPAVDVAPPANPGLDAPVTHDRHADVLKCTLLLAAAVRSGGLTRQEALDTMHKRRAEGRWSRHVPDEEIVRALDGALAKGGHVVTDPASAAHALDDALVPFTDAEYDAAKLPHPHAFACDQQGMFPLGEVTVIGAPGREGKTSTMMALAESYTLGWDIAGLAPTPDRAVLIYSAEDDRAQYARKAAAHRLRHTPERAALFTQRLLVPDLHGPALAVVREIVTLQARQPTRGAIVEQLIASLLKRPHVGLVIFETASTLSDAEEDNPGHKALIAALKHVAKSTNTAVVLMHHTSQAASNNLPTLDISEADIRGGTALVNNARQTFLLVNLGSTIDPHPEGDARTLLRSLVAKGERDRISMLVCLSTSKGKDPPPVFFRWDDTPYGPRLVEHPAPASLAGKSWRALKGALHGARVEAKAEKKAAEGQGNVRLVVNAVEALAGKGEQPTVAKVSAVCGRSNSWAKPYLQSAVEAGELVRSTEQVPRTQGFTDVYRLPSGAMPWNTSQNEATPR